MKLGPYVILLLSVYEFSLKPVKIEENIFNYMYMPEKNVHIMYLLFNVFNCI